MMLLWKNIKILKKKEKRLQVIHDRNRKYRASSREMRTTTEITNSSSASEGVLVTTRQSITVRSLLM